VGGTTRFIAVVKVSDDGLGHAVSMTSFF